MGYWWVSQGKTFKEEFAGGYLWAPLRDKSGGTPFHWRTMERVAPGDVIFSYTQGQIAAVSVARSAAHASLRPSEFPASADVWEQRGLHVDAVYQRVEPRLPKQSFLEGLKPLLPATHSPIMGNGNGFTGYLFELPGAAGSYLADLVGGSEAGPIEAAVAVAAPETEREALVRARKGQGPFRDALEKEWGGRCAVSGVSTRALLRASHIKPWRDSSNAERLDPANGLLLSAAYDAAFDARLISFDDTGRLVRSERLSVDDASRAGLDLHARISSLSAARLGYLRGHRERLR